MYILIPLILSAVCSFVNPYVGLFGIFTLVEIIIILCVDINANVRIKLSHKVSAENPSRAERLKKSGKVLAAAECVLTALHPCKGRRIRPDERHHFKNITLPAEERRRLPAVSDADKNRDDIQQSAVRHHTFHA